MRKIAIWAVKGGVGKSTVTARLGLALKDAGYQIGFLDIDCTGSTLPSALGIPEPWPHPVVDVPRNKMFPIQVNGYDIFALCFRAGRAAVMLEGSEQKIEVFGQEFTLHGTGIWNLVKQMLANVEFPDDIDYLLIDCPPTSGDQMLSLFENLRDIWGVILVCQPTNLAIEDMDRALNMIEVKRIPLLGMVENMAMAICPQCSHNFSPFIDPGMDLRQFCTEKGIPYLGSIPFTSDVSILNVQFNYLVQEVVEVTPVKIWELSFKEKLERATIRGLIKSGFLFKQVE
jgi:ATP-binding protein involved in chromosome partitioning